MPGVMLVCIGLLSFAPLFAYAPSFDGRFVFDDRGSILQNPAVRTLWPFAAAAEQNALTGRPVARFTFAINYALGRFDPTGYHLVNLALHIATGILLWDLLSRSLLLLRQAQGTKQAGHQRSDEGACRWFSLIVVLLWSVHPLLTESITYLVQRTELLGSLFLVLSVYAALRSWEASRRGAWYAVSVAAAFAGVLSKEIAAAAPLLVLAYDWLVVRAPARQLLRQRWPLYAGLGASWLLLIGVLAAGGRSESVGFHLGASAWEYLQMQAWAIGHYLRLAIWPLPLCLDYGTIQSAEMQLSSQWPRYVPGGLAVLTLLGATVFATVRRWPAAWLGIAFFAILAPTSSFIPIVTEPAAERRMYLPLAALIAAAALGLVRLWHWLAARLPEGWFQPRRAGQLAIGAAVIVGLAWGVLTFRRNQAYANPVQLWQETARLRPGNPRAWHLLGDAQADRNNLAGAIAAYNTAVSLVANDDYVDALVSLARVSCLAGQSRQAIDVCQRAIKALDRQGHPGVDARVIYATALAQLDMMPESIELASEAVRRAVPASDQSFRANLELGRVLIKNGDPRAAIGPLAEALRVQPNSYDALISMFNAQMGVEDFDAAIEYLPRAIAVRPTDPDVYWEAAKIMAHSGRGQRALDLLAQALQLKPDHSGALNARGAVLYAMRRGDDDMETVRAAVQSFIASVNADPTNIDARLNLAELLIYKLSDFRAAHSILKPMAEQLPGNTRVMELWEQVRFVPDAPQP